MKTKSLLRKLEYKALAELTIDGAVLDVGGSTKSGYHELLKGNHTITTANIDTSYGAEVVFDAQKPWPIEDAAYDAVLFINVLEHLYDYQTPITEAHRVLRPGGRVVSATPFLFRVHGSPDDYFRYSKSALMRMYTDVGFSTVTITELGTGAFSVVYHLIMSIVPWTWLAAILMNICMGIDGLLERIKPKNGMSRESMPLGYLVIATK